MYDRMGRFLTTLAAFITTLFGPDVSRVSWHTPRPFKVSAKPETVPHLVPPEIFTFTIGRGVLVPCSESQVTIADLIPTSCRTRLIPASTPRADVHHFASEHGESCRCAG